MSEPLVEVEGLRKHFGTLQAVRGIDFRVHRGDVLGFLGPNGAGKSTTMKMVTGFLRPTAGRVRVCGHELERDPIAVKAALGYMPEGAPAYAEMTPRGLLTFIARVRGLDGAERRRRIEEMVTRIHLEAVVDQRIETLSKGYKRRVGLAAALLHDPAVLILDEPTDGLDPNQKHEVRALIREIAPDKAIVISTHILEEVEAVCNRVLIIAAGSVVFSGTPAGLAACSPAHNAVRLTVDAAIAEAARAALEALAGVAAVECTATPGDLVELLVRPAGEGSIAAEVASLAHHHGWQVHALAVERGRLDEVFRSITEAAA